VDATACHATSVIYSDNFCKIVHRMPSTWRRWDPSLTVLTHWQVFSAIMATDIN
jgi:hypothetical protein